MLSRIEQIRHDRPLVECGLVFGERDGFYHPRTAIADGMIVLVTMGFCTITSFLNPATSVGML